MWVQGRFEASTPQWSEARTKRGVLRKAPATNAGQAKPLLMAESIADGSP